MHEEIQNEYTTMVKRLSKPGQSICQSLTAGKAHMLHMAVGLTGEVLAELIPAIYNTDQENLLEELGDIEFYFRGLEISIEVNIDINLKLDEHLTSEKTRECLIKDLTLSCGEILDSVKRIVIYEKPIEKQSKVLLLHLMGFRSLLTILYSKLNLTAIQARNHNINKLLKGKNARYAEGSYSDKQANDRADKK